MATTRGSSKLGLILQLEALAIHHEQLAAAIRTTLSLVRGEAKVPREDAGSLVSQALQMDVARRGGRRELPATNGSRNGHGPAIVQQRQKTADKLAQFDRSEPRRVPGLNNAGVLIANGYLEKRPGGFIRTDKPFIVDRTAAPAAAAKVVKHPKKQGYWNKAATVARRKRTAKSLAVYDTKTPQPLTGKGMGALIAAGYLRQQGGGYVRTAKVFEP